MTEPARSPRPPLSRRRVLTAMLLVPPALAGCSFGAGAGADAPEEPDPLIALAEAARADAALAAVAIAASPELADRLQPLVDARTQHAAALDAEVARLDPADSTTRPTPAPTTSTAGRGTSLEQVRDAVRASGEAARAAALELPPDRVGLVAAVAACCATYAEVLA
ncbi:hypothetical protein [Pseudonocardia nigra]|uniref:hypothetical protein n=1 Tax=Pseudonocardia nigra TaxID=1921578 RepID=UPI001C5EB809|nr:hypothetical protein [Pseudonocardia nigra]